LFETLLELITQQTRIIGGELQSQAWYLRCFIDTDGNQVGAPFRRLLKAWSFKCLGGRFAFHAIVVECISAESDLFRPTGRKLNPIEPEFNAIVVTRKNSPSLNPTNLPSRNSRTSCAPLFLPR
jgi:hypothetical protein